MVWASPHSAMAMGESAREKTRRDIRPEAHAGGSAGLTRAKVRVGIEAMAVGAAPTERLYPGPQDRRRCPCRRDHSASAFREFVLAAPVLYRITETGGKLTGAQSAR